MKIMKEMRFYIDTPPIDIQQLSEKDDFQIEIDLHKNDFVARLNIGLDPKSIEWDTHDGDDVFPRNFNRLIMSLSTESEVSYTKFLENAYFVVIEYLDIFFRFIQIKLGQYWVDIGSIPDWDLFIFLDKTNAKQIVGGREENIGIPIGGYSKKIIFSPKRRRYPDWSDGLDVKQAPNIKTWIGEYKTVPLEQQLLADSKRLLLHNDYKSSSVQAMTALEGPLEAFVKARCKSKGIAKKSDKVAYNLKLFPSTLEPNELTEWLDNWLESDKHWFAGKFNGDQIIDWARELNTKRNKAVHEGKTPDFDTLDKGIFAVEAIYNFVKESK